MHWAVKLGEKSNLNIFNTNQMATWVNNEAECISLFISHTGKVDIVRILIQNGAKINVKNNNGKTPMVIKV